MGNSQSTQQQPLITEKLTERLRAMQLEHEKDYLLVEKFGTYRSSLGNSVSVSTTEKWLQDLLSDPKVCFLFS
jgi:hypothetical protein